MGCAWGCCECAPKCSVTVALEPSGKRRGWEGGGKPGGVVLAEGEQVDMPRGLKVQDIRDDGGQMCWKGGRATAGVLCVRRPGSQEGRAG